MILKRRSTKEEQEEEEEEKEEKKERRMRRRRSTGLFRLPDMEDNLHFFFPSWCVRGSEGKREMRRPWLEGKVRIGKLKREHVWRFWYEGKRQGKKRGKKFKIARESSLTEEEEKSLKTERGRKEGRKIGRKKGERSWRQKEKESNKKKNK